jgi:hypothetical protein
MGSTLMSKHEKIQSPENTMPVKGNPITPRTKTVITGILVVLALLFPIIGFYYGLFQA